MNDLSDDLLERVQGLTREEALEAALALGERLGAGEVSGEEVQRFLAELEEEPYAAVEDVEQLARTALIVAAADPDTSDTVREVVDAVGQKAFIFGGAEIVIVGTIAVALLQTALAKGRSSEEEILEVIDEKTGKRVVHRRKTSYGISPGVGKLLSGLLHSG